MTGATVRKYRVLSVTRFCLLVILASCGDHRRQVRLPYAEPGQIQFQSYCAACHQYDGQRMGDAPALAGSQWVTGPASRLIRIVLHGVRSPMVVDGKTYDREMPGFRADFIGHSSRVPAVVRPQAVRRIFRTDHSGDGEPSTRREPDADTVLACG